MLLSAVSVLVVAQSSSEIREGLLNNPVYFPFIFKLNTMEHDMLRFKTKYIKNRQFTV